MEPRSLTFCPSSAKSDPCPEPVAGQDPGPPWRLVSVGSMIGLFAAVLISGLATGALFRMRSAQPGLSRKEREEVYRELAVHRRRKSTMPGEQEEETPKSS